MKTTRQSRRRGHSAVTLPDGSMLMTGGETAEGLSNQVPHFLPLQKHGSFLMRAGVPSNTYSLVTTCLLSLFCEVVWLSPKKRTSNIFSYDMLRVVNIYGQHFEKMLYCQHVLAAFRNKMHFRSEICRAGQVWRWVNQSCWDPDPTNGLALDETYPLDCRFRPVHDELEARSLS